jgi:PAS domain S-box-containing protein
MRDAIHVVDSDLVVLLMNHQFETWCRELGLKIDNPIGKTVFELFPDLPEKVREEYRDVFENGQVLMTMDVIKTQGREVTTETLKIPVRKAGRVVRVVTVVRDITRQEQIKRESNASERRLSLLFETIPHAVYECDQDGVITFTNGAYARITGYSKEALVGMHIHELMAPGPQKEGMAAYLEQLVQERPVPTPYSTKNLNKDGQLIDVEVNWNYRCNDQDQIVGFVCILSDITARKLAEQELGRAKKQAEADSRAKSQFLVNMSHEIRTPMSVIMGCADLMKMDEMAEEKRLVVELLRRASKSMVRIADDILCVSKIETGKLTVERAECCVRRLLRDVEAMIRPLAEKQGLEFSVVCDDDVPAAIVTDCERVLQCLLNIAGNAVKYTDRGHVHLSVSSHDVNGARCIRFDVADTGIGIPAEKLDSVFELFMQMDTGKTRKYDGAGLGLAIPRQLAELLGGTLTVTSDVGIGSVFSLIIPAPDGVVVEKEPGAGSKPKAVKKFSGNVLLVDDYDGIRKTFGRLLERLGLKVTMAENGREAVDLALSQPFDVVLMDVQMPVLDGYSATRMLREKGVDTPIVALTAHAMESDRQTCLDAGCNDYLSKPIDQDELLRVLRTYVAKNT